MNTLVLTVIRWLKREPLVVSAISAAVLTLAAHFGVNLDGAATATVGGALSAVAVAVARAFVTPSVSVPAAPPSTP